MVAGCVLGQISDCHNPNIRQEINGNALKHVANFVSFSFSHGQRAPWVEVEP
jgi:hypothetical protein